MEFTAEFELAAIRGDSLPGGDHGWSRSRDYDLIIPALCPDDGAEPPAGVYVKQVGDCTACVWRRNTKGGTHGWNMAILRPKWCAEPAGVVLRLVRAGSWWETQDARPGRAFSSVECELDCLVRVVT